MDITKEWLLDQGFTELTGDRYEFKYEPTLSITVENRARSERGLNDGEDEGRDSGSAEIIN